MTFPLRTDLSGTRLTCQPWYTYFLFTFNLYTASDSPKSTPTPISQIIATKDEIEWRNRPKGKGNTRRKGWSLCSMEVQVLQGGVYCGTEPKVPSNLIDWIEWTTTATTTTTRTTRTMTTRTWTMMSTLIGSKQVGQQTEWFHNADAGGGGGAVEDTHYSWHAALVMQRLQFWDLKRKIISEIKGWLQSQTCRWRRSRRRRRSQKQKGEGGNYVKFEPSSSWSLGHLDSWMCFKCRNMKWI